MPINVLVATHSREVKTALFIALKAIPTIAITATATSTAELISYTTAFKPDIVIVESGLPGKPLTEALQGFDSLDAPQRILVIGGENATAAVGDVAKAEILRDVDHLISILPDLETKEAS